MKSQSGTLIGHITDVQNNSFTASIALDEKGCFPVIQSDSGQILAGQIGSYVSVRQLDIHILARVNQAKVVSGTRTRQPEEAQIDTHELRHGQLTLIPLGELNEGKFRRGICHFPTPGAETHIIDHDEIEPLFSDYAKNGFDVGYLPSLPSTHVSLNPTALFGRHTAILGQSGSGKSWGVASLLQRAITTMPNAHIVLLDLHGEYHWFDNDGIHRSAFDDKVVNYLDARELEIPYWLLTFSELVDLFVDRAEEGASIQIAFMREVVHSLRKKANKEMDPADITIDTPVYFSMAELYRYFKTANEKHSDFGKTKGPLAGKFDDFLIRMQSRLNDVRYDFLFKPKRRRSSASLSGLLRDLLGLGQKRCQITIIDLSTVPFDVRPTVSAQIGRLAFEFNFWNPHSSEFPILLVCEEAHTYIPRESDTRFEGTRKSIERIAKEGRKYGVALVVVSQRPHELSETVLAQCANFLCFRITNPDDQQYVRNLVPDGESGLIDTLAALGRGEVMALGEAVPIPLRFQMHKPDPQPNSQDIDLHTHWKSGPDDLDVDSIVDNWRNQQR